MTRPDRLIDPRLAEAYRSVRKLSEPRHQAVLHRLQVSVVVEAHEGEKAAASEIANPWFWGSVAMAIAAAIVLALAGPRLLGRSSEQASNGSAAGYVLVSEASRLHATPGVEATQASNTEPELPAPTAHELVAGVRADAVRVTRVPPAPAHGGLASELDLVRRAEAALSAHRPEAALTALMEHERSFPRGQLLEDRRALQIRALCAAGDRDAGRARLGTFSHDFPASPHRERLRTACADP